MSAWPSSHTKVIRMREKICPICGKTFAGDKRRKYCSDTCRTRREYNVKRIPKSLRPPRIVNCAICGNAFEVSYESLRKYCSAACKKIAQKRRAHERYIANYTPIEYTCQVCGKRFWGNESPAKIYCSDACRAIGDRRRRERYYDVNRETFREKHAQKMANRGPSEPHPRRKSDSPITRLRIAKNLQQKQLAEIIGCDPRCISRWETRMAYPDTTSAIKLACALDCTVGEIYGIDPSNDWPATAAADGDNIIARLREERGMSREQLAEELGCHVSSIQHWEHGLYPPGRNYVISLANLFCCRVDDLLQPFFQKTGSKPVDNTHK